MKNFHKIRLVQPVFSPYLFWDIDKEKLDFIKNAAFVVQRVFELGTVEDIAEVTAYYGKHDITKILTSAVSLKENALYLASMLFKVSLDKFQCYTSIQSRQHL